MEPVRAACKVLSDVCADMGWIIPLSKLTIPTSPLLQHSSHEGARKTQHEADKPDRVHEHGRSGGAEGILGIDGWACVTRSSIGGSRKLLGYLCKEGLGDGIGVLL